MATTSWWWARVVCGPVIAGLTAAGSGCAHSGERTQTEAAAAGAKAQPVIDMHLHAFPADFFGPPPQRICAPVERFRSIEGNRPMRLDTEGDNALIACSSPLVAPATSDELLHRTLEVMRRNGVVAALASGPLVDRWHAADRQRILPCLQNLTRSAVDDLRTRAGRGQLAAIAEITAQYAGQAPDDPALEPYYALAEELDIPVGIHMGPGPPGAGYLQTKYRAKLTDPFGLEPVLLRHPRLRLYVMHAGWPMGDAMVHMMYAHPQLYVDVGVIDYYLPREEFYQYLQRLVRAGMAERVMFGSDQMLWPEAIEIGIQRIRSAPFLTPQQKHDILYGNAARFLRLDEKRIQQHHALAAERR
jgi:hypothetical protein